MSNIIINNRSEIKNANGRLNSKRCKPVICIDTGEVYTSATDAANANGATIWGISEVCLGKLKTTKGKRFCYLADVSEHLDEMTNRIRTMHANYAEMETKAKAYDALMAEQEAKREAERVRQWKITSLESKLARRREIVTEIEAKLQDAKDRVTETENELNALKANESEVN